MLKGENLGDANKLYKLFMKWALLSKNYKMEQKARSLYGRKNKEQ